MSGLVLMDEVVEMMEKLRERLGVRLREIWEVEGVCWCVWEHLDGVRWRLMMARGCVVDLCVL